MQTINNLSSPSYSPAPTNTLIPVLLPPKPAPPPVLCGTGISTVPCICDPNYQVYSANVINNGKTIQWSCNPKLT